MDQFQIKCVYHADGLAENLRQWFHELVPNIDVSMAVWEEMAPKIINNLNGQFLQIQINRVGFNGQITEALPEPKEETPEPVKIDGSKIESPKPPQDSMDDENSPVNALIKYHMTQMPENTQAFLINVGTGNVSYHDSLRSAIGAWKDNADEVVLVKDITLQGMLKILNRVRLNLNNHIITSCAADHAIWVKESAVIYNGQINCLGAVKSAIFVSSTLVVWNLILQADVGVILNKDKNEPALLETHGMVVRGDIAVSMQQDGNILNDYGCGLESKGLLVQSVKKEDTWEHRVFIHRKPGVDAQSKYNANRFSENIRVTFL